MNRFITSITGAIGGTHLLRLDKLQAAYGLTGQIFAKLEHMSPGFSKKDRIALGMIEEAERKGELKPGMPVIETTSGNTGIGLAIVCAAKGYRLICVMSEGNSRERVAMIKALGGEIVLVKQAEGSKKGFVRGSDMDLVMTETRRVVEETGGYYVRQFENTDNSMAQELMGEEIWTQTNGEIDVFADFIGTGGTFAGVSRRLKHYNPSIKCYAVEPEGCAFYAEGTVTRPGHRIQGGGYGKHQINVDRELIDGCIAVNDEQAILTARDLARYEGVFGGFSSGANVAAAVELLKGAEHGKRIAVVVNDTGLKYMSTDLYE